MKLLSYFQSQGVSRRTFTSLVDQGNVLLNGQAVESYKIEVNDGDIIEWRLSADMPFAKILIENHDVDGSKQQGHLLVFHKPIGYVCSKSDPHNETIYTLLPQKYKHWYYIGRLDKNSRGLVLMTDDPKLVDQYEHPRHGITKEYLVTLNKPLRDLDKSRCMDGIEDDGELLSCVKCNIDYSIETPSFLPEDDRKQYTVVRMVLNEGKKRHIRRMMSALRYHVEDLMRVREGDFELGDLKEGEWKEIIGDF